MGDLEVYKKGIFPTMRRYYSAQKRTSPNVTRAEHVVLPEHDPEKFILRDCFVILWY